MGSTRRSSGRPVARVVTLGVAVTILTIGAAVTPAAAAKKVKACTLVPQVQLETAVGNAFDPPQDSSLGQFEASCRFPSTDVGGADLNLFLAADVKGGVKDAFGGNFFATKKSFQKVHDGVAPPVPGVGKQAFTAFDGSSSVAQGSLLVLDAKNHGAVIVLTGDGVTAENTIEKGKAVAELVLAKLK
jgi:hypothetical protein